MLLEAERFLKKCIIFSFPQEACSLVKSTEVDYRFKVSDGHLQFTIVCNYS